MLLQLFRKTIIRRMKKAGFCIDLQNKVLKALHLRKIKTCSCIELIPFNPLFDTLPEKEVLTEGEFMMFPDWFTNCSCIYTKRQELNKNICDTCNLYKNEVFSF